MTAREQAIEAAATAMFDDQWNPSSWETSITETARRNYRSNAARALDAALPVLLNDLADRIANQAWDAYTAAAIVRAAAEGWGQ